MRFLRLGFILLLSMYCATVLYAAPQLKTGHPTRYEVKTNDTVWHVASQFLEKPWEWSQLWAHKPPEKLFAGDIIVFHRQDGQPRLSIVGGGTVKLSPKIRTTPLQTPIPTIPFSRIKPFIRNAMVVSADELNTFPYIVAFSREQTVAATGDLIYARGAKMDKAKAFYIFRRTRPYTDPQTRAILGYEALDLGSAQLIKGGDPLTLRVTNSVNTIHIGDSLIPAKAEQTPPYLYPSAPRQTVSGQIIDVLSGVTQIGQFDTVVINRGSQAGIQAGNVLSVFRGAKRQIDRRAERDQRAFYLPKFMLGDILIFRVFPKVSFALVMHASGPIRVGSGVQNP